MNMSILDQRKTEKMLETWQAGEALSKLRSSKRLTEAAAAAAAQKEQEEREENEVQIFSKVD